MGQHRRNKHNENTQENPERNTVELKAGYFLKSVALLRELWLFTVHAISPRVLVSNRYPINGDPKNHNPIRINNPPTP